MHVRINRQRVLEFGFENIIRERLIHGRRRGSGRQLFGRRNISAVYGPYLRVTAGFFTEPICRTGPNVRRRINYARFTNII